MHAIDEQGNVYRGGDAYVFLQRVFNRPFSGLMGMQPIKALVDLAYRVVSSHRPFFARFLYTKEKWAE